MEESKLEAHKMAASRAIERLAEAGYVNKDLAWRHVGFYYPHNLKNQSTQAKTQMEDKRLVAVMFDMQLELLDEGNGEIRKERKEEVISIMKKCLSLNRCIQIHFCISPYYIKKVDIRKKLTNILFQLSYDREEERGGRGGLEKTMGLIGPSLFWYVIDR